MANSIIKIYQICIKSFEKTCCFKSIVLLFYPPFAHCGWGGFSGPSFILCLWMKYVAGNFLALTDLFFRHKLLTKKIRLQSILSRFISSIFRKFFIDFSRFSSIFIDFCRFSSIFIDFRRFSSIFIDFYRFSSLCNIFCLFLVNFRQIIELHLTYVTFSFQNSINFYTFSSIFIH